MRSLIVGLALSSLTLAAPAAASCLDFDTYTPGLSAGVGPLLSLSDGNVRLNPFHPMSGPPTAGGSATVVNSNWAVGTPANELWLANINLVVDAIPDVTYAKFNYADYGGSVNFGVNGVVLVAADLSDLGVPAGGGTFTTTVAGVAVTITRTDVPPSYHHGTVLMTAPPGVVIDTFGVGGQEFFVDHVCW